MDPQTDGHPEGGLEQDWDSYGIFLDQPGTVWEHVGRIHTDRHVGAARTRRVGRASSMGVEPCVRIGVDVGSRLAAFLGFRLSAEASRGV